MESAEGKAFTLADFDPDLAAAMVRIKLARRHGDCRGPGRWILNQTPEGRINAVQTEFEPAKIRESYHRIYRVAIPFTATSAFIGR